MASDAQQLDQPSAAPDVQADLPLANGTPAPDSETAAGASPTKASVLAPEAVIAGITTDSKLPAEDDVAAAAAPDEAEHQPAGQPAAAAEEGNAAAGIGQQMTDISLSQDLEATGTMPAAAPDASLVDASAGAAEGCGSALMSARTGSSLFFCCGPGVQCIAMDHSCTTA